MPNLLPDWTLTLPWDLGDLNTRAAGRLFWSVVLLVIGISVVMALMKPPKLTRPFSTKVGVALFFVIIVGTLVVAKFVSPLQRTIILLGLVVLVAHSFLMIRSRAHRDLEEPATWAECFAGAVGVFALMALGYAIVPHEFLTYANAELKWGDTSRFVIRSGHQVLGFLPVDWPFSFDYPALRDVGVTIIYVVLLGLNLKLWAMWQQRRQVSAAADAGEETPAKLSPFGRPLLSMRGGATASVTTTTEGT